MTRSSPSPSPSDAGPSLPDPLRHLLAGAAGAAAFLALFFGLRLIAVLALLGAALVYGATLLIVRRRPPPAERMLTDEVSEADLKAAMALMEASAARLAALEPQAPPEDRGLFEGMARSLRRIAAHHGQDPRDLRHTRRFLRHDLGRIVETAESYVDLARRAGPAEAERLAGLSKRIQSFAPALDRIERACLENDFMRLEVEAEVLSDQLAAR